MSGFDQPTDPPCTGGCGRTQCRCCDGCGRTPCECETCDECGRVVGAQDGCRCAERDRWLDEAIEDWKERRL